MNDEEIRSPDDVEFQEVDMGKPPATNKMLLKVASGEDNDDEFSSVALSEARNNNHQYDEYEGEGSGGDNYNRHKQPQISEETPSESAPLDSQYSEQSRDEDLQLISEQVREGGLPVSEETIKMAKILLPDGDQV